MARKRPNPKKLEQAELRELNAIQITIVASEANLQRLSALLQYVEPMPKMIQFKEQAPLPWEEEGAPKPPPMLEIDRPAVENAITPLLQKYVDAHGREKAIEMIKSFGAERLRLLNDEQLVGLYHALAGEAASE